MEHWDNDRDINPYEYEELDNHYDNWDKEIFYSLNRDQDDHDSLFGSTDSENGGNGNNEDDNDRENDDQLSIRKPPWTKQMRITKRGDKKINDIQKLDGNNDSDKDEGDLDKEPAAIPTLCRSTRIQASTAATSSR